MLPSSKTIIVEDGQVLVRGYRKLPSETRDGIDAALRTCGIDPVLLDGNDGTLVVPHIIEDGATPRNLAALLGSLIHPMSRKRSATERSKAGWRLRSYPVFLDFADINSRANVLADTIEAKGEELTELLMRYETFDVASDETVRTLDLLRNLSENAGYFVRRIGPVAAFLPRNQPLYALACFGIVPALMASEAYIRPPLAMRHFFFDLVALLGLADFFPTMSFSRQGHEEFVRERAEVRLDARGVEVPVTDAVVFTGTMANADKVRRAFPKNVLFIANGPGHNPIVVSETADIKKAVASVLRVQLYNQGQDCANANGILVHDKRYEEFVWHLRNEVKEVKVGPYAERENRVGPVTNRKDLERIQALFVENAEWLDPMTPGVIRTRPCIVEPTIILKPLSLGGDYRDHFAPVFFVQRYNTDHELSQYFEDPRYVTNAMYVTLYYLARARMWTASLAASSRAAGCSTTPPRSSGTRTCTHPAWNEGPNHMEDTDAAHHPSAFMGLQPRNRRCHREKSSSSS